MAVDKNYPKSARQRGFELLKLAAKVGSKEILNRTGLMKSSELEQKIEQVQTLVEDLSKLKGAAMKLGQWISLEFLEELPQEVRDLLSRIHYQAEPLLSSQQVSEKLNEYLKSKALQAFEITKPIEEAIACASIGQVHQVYLNGKVSALKIRYPDIEKTLESDLKTFTRLVPLVSKISGKKIDYQPLFNELSSMLLQELDYLQELKSQKRAYDFFIQYPDYRVPKPIEELCTKEWIASEWIEGVHLNEWLKSSPRLSERSELARKLMDLFYLEAFKLRMVQTDPNLGNFKILGSQLVLLDFGACKTFSVEFMKQYRELVLASDQEDWDFVLNKSIQFGLLSDSESPETKQFFVEMMKTSALPFHPRSQPFDFGNREYTTELRQKSLKFVKSVKFSAPPHELIFLQRKLLGIFNILRTLQVQYDLTLWIQKIRETKFE